MQGIGEVHQFPWNGVRCWSAPFQDARSHPREPPAEQPLHPANRAHVEFAHHVVIAVALSSISAQSSWMRPTRSPFTSCTWRPTR